MIDVILIIEFTILEGDCLSMCVQE